MVKSIFWVKERGALSANDLREIEEQLYIDNMVWNIVINSEVVFNKEQ
jgi:hypothetical protein